MPSLPVPDASGIYTFPDDLIAAHRTWQDELAARQGTAPLLTVTAPHSGTHYVIEQRQPIGRPVVVLEPHHDDFALSASGLFLARPRPLTVITIFSRSTSVHPALEAAYSDAEVVSALRAREGAEALRPFAARQILLGHEDAAKPYRAYAPRRLSTITEELRALLDENPDAELLAPAGVTRHPDHLLVHEAACRLGCRWFFEDLAFWPTYALSGCDQHLFRTRTGSSLCPRLADITNVLLDKLTLLCLHGSQMHPPAKMYRPLRHAWTIAADLLDPPRGTPAYAERSHYLETP
ncbi:PIG-L family deacetylase [Streptomyces sp. B8F3]|uniref:PIG-L family deacetylase n=1 Tax=unclassified Streptomyces TaxID=2593676 RepID=UPI00325CEC66